MMIQERMPKRRAEPMMCMPSLLIPLPQSMRVDLKETPLYQMHRATKLKVHIVVKCIRTCNHAKS